MFDTSAFMDKKFRRREKKIPAPDLKKWFIDDEPVWTIRAITASEHARAKDARDRRRRIETIAEALVQSNSSGAVQDIRNALGHGDDVPDDVVYRQELLAIASVSPECDLPLAVRLSEWFPVFFYQVTNEILGLMGEAPEDAEKKPPTAGETPK